MESSVFGRAACAARHNYVTGLTKGRVSLPMPFTQATPLTYGTILSSAISPFSIVK